MRSEKRNGEATAFRRPTICTGGSTPRPRPCGSSRAVATPVFRFQKVVSAKGEEALERQGKSRGETFCAVATVGAGLPSGARKDRERKKERTTHSCIVR